VLVAQKINDFITAHRELGLRPDDELRRGARRTTSWRKVSSTGSEWPGAAHHGSRLRRHERIGAAAK
jgi:hypothetical protein